MGVRLFSSACQASSGGCSTHSSNTFVCLDMQFGRQRNLGRGHETRGFVSHSVWSYFSFHLPPLSCSFPAVLSVSPHQPPSSVSVFFSPPASPLPFFCSKFSGIIFSGVFYKNALGRFKEYLSQLLVLITRSRHTQLAPFLFE